MNEVPAPQASLVHVVSVVSRSGRASAEIARVDLDDVEENLAETANRIAGVAHHPTRDAERHADLAMAILTGFEEVERVPGQPVTREATLSDGRRASVKRMMTM